MIIVSKEAEEELEQARAYLNLQAVGLGERLLDDVEFAFSSILEMPHAHPKLELLTFLSPYRRVLLRTFRYVIIYEILSDCILVVAVAHTSRKPNYWLSRTTAT